MHLLESLYILHQEAIGIIPGQEHILQHISHSFLLESQVLGSYDRRVDEVQPREKKALLIVLFDVIS